MTLELKKRGISRIALLTYCYPSPSLALACMESCAIINVMTSSTLFNSCSNPLTCFGDSDPMLPFLEQRKLLHGARAGKY